MNARHRAFAEYYAQTANATEAAVKAGFSARTAYSQGYRLLKNVEVQNLIQELQERAASERIADMETVKGFWSDVMRDEGEKTADRLKASELLAKSAGAFLDRVAVGDFEGKDVILYIPDNGRDMRKKEDDTE